MNENNKNGKKSDTDAVDDLLGEVIGSVLSAVGQLALFVLVWAVRLPAVSIPLIAVGAVGHQFGQRPAILVGVLIAVVLLVWGLVAPAALRAVTVDVVATRWRVWRRYRDWAGACTDCGLTRTRGDNIATPKLQQVRLGESADVLVVRMLRGQTAADYSKAADALAGAFDAEAVRVEQNSPQQVRLIVQRGQPLATPLTPNSPSGPAAAARDVRRPEAATPTSQPDGGLGPVTVGKTAGGGPWRLPIVGNHLLIGGVTGSGKGSVLWSIIGGLAPHVRSGFVRLLVADPKGGMELGAGAPLFDSFAYQGEPIARMLAEAVETMTARAQRLRGISRTHTATVAEPQVVVIIDELAALTAFADRKLKTDIEHSLGLLLSQGRAVGISVIAAVQDPSKDIVPLRQFFPLRLGLRMAEPTQTTMILGPGALDAGARCHQLPAHLPGLGYIATDATNSPTLVRAFHYRDNHITSLIDRYTPPAREQQPATDTETGTGVDGGGDDGQDRR